MRILVLEDNPKHAQDARTIVVNLIGCQVDFASNQAEADLLVKSNTYDAAILDVFYPATADGNADSFENAIAFSKQLTEARTHHVFNTSGNHHGEKYQDFIWKTPVAVYNNDEYHFLTFGQIIEAYPEDSNADKDTKQWQAALRYVILVHEMIKLEDKGQLIIKEMELQGYPYGDYGGATKAFQQAAMNHFVDQVYKRYGI